MTACQLNIPTLITRPPHSIYAVHDVHVFIYSTQDMYMLSMTYALLYQQDEDKPPCSRTWSVAVIASDGPSAHPRRGAASRGTRGQSSRKTSRKSGGENH